MDADTIAWVQSFFPQLDTIEENLKIFGPEGTFVDDRSLTSLIGLEVGALDEIRKQCAHGSNKLYGSNILHVAADNGYFELIKFLVENKLVNINSRDNDQYGVEGMSALDFVVERKISAIISEQSAPPERKSAAYFKAIENYLKEKGAKSYVKFSYSPAMESWETGELDLSGAHEPKDLGIESTGTVVESEPGPELTDMRGFDLDNVANPPPGHPDHKEDDRKR